MVTGVEEKKELESGSPSAKSKETRRLITSASFLIKKEDKYLFVKYKVIREIGSISKCRRSCTLARSKKSGEVREAGHGNRPS